MTKFGILFSLGLFIAAPVEANFFSAIAKIAKGGDEVAAVTAKNADEVITVTADDVTTVMKTADEGAVVIPDELLGKTGEKSAESGEIKPEVIKESLDIIGAGVDIAIEAAGICEQDCQSEEASVAD